MPVNKVSSTKSVLTRYFAGPRFTTLLCPLLPVTVVKFFRPEVVRWFTIRIRNPNSIMITARMLACPARLVLIPTYWVLSVDSFR